MRDVPEIAPEVRGLLEEIVANPRSSMRLVPRRALLPWIEGGQAAATRELSSGAAERHLLAAHREAVALLLRQAAHIAFWKAPSLAHRPTGPDGVQFDPADGESSWRARAQGRLSGMSHPDEGIELLRRCLSTVEFAQGADLARASSTLVPTDEASLAVAEYSKNTDPRTALRLYEGIAQRSGTPLLRGIAWAGSGSRLCHLGDFSDAARSYQRAREGWVSAWFSLFNIACIQESRAHALDASREIGRLWAGDSSQVAEAVQLLAPWSRGLSRAEFRAAQRTITALRGQLSEAASRIAQIYA